MKLPLYFFLALLITACIFSFMRYLISADVDTPQSVDIAAIVELWQQPPRPEPTPTPQEAPPDEEISEPSMPETAVPSTPSKPQLAMDLAPSAQMGNLAIATGETGQWSVPVTGKLAELLDDGKDNKGFVEVTPYSTRVPNIPLIAWQNKINGWVLVVFNVNVEGRTENIKVLDANPKGIFEEEVVRAVGRWRYPLGSLQNYQGNLVLTQKIQLFYRNYPKNLRYD